MIWENNLVMRQYKIMKEKQQCNQGQTLVYQPLVLKVVK